MRKGILVLVMIFFVGLASSAFAIEGGYVRGFAGAGLLDDSTISLGGVDLGEVKKDIGFNVGGAIGFDGGRSRTEAEVTYRYNSIDAIVTPIGTFSVKDSYYQSISLMVNVFINILPSGNIMPYLGGGIGGAFIITGDNDDSEEDTVFAGQVMPGVGITISDNVVIDVEYRFFIAAEPTFGQFKDEYLHHGLNLGVRVGF